jgi:hypothetical protein
VEWLNATGAANRPAVSRMPMLKVIFFMGAPFRRHDTSHGALWATIL